MGGYRPFFALRRECFLPTVEVIYGYCVVVNLFYLYVALLVFNLCPVCPVVGHVVAVCHFGVVANDVVDSQSCGASVPSNVVLAVAKVVAVLVVEIDVIPKLTLAAVAVLPTCVACATLIVDADVVVARM